MAELKRIRIFLSSPEDVLPERRIAEGAIRRLSREFEPHLEIETVFAKTPGLEPLPSSADIVLVTFWSQLGPLLPRRKSFAGAVSGLLPMAATEWEFEEALAAHRAGGRPELLLFRKTAPVLAELADREAVLKQVQDQEVVADFFSRWNPRRKAEAGVIWNNFADAAGFEDLLLEQLRPLLRRHLPADEAAAEESPYRGLAGFGREEAALFFGRTRAKHDLRELLTRRAKAGQASVVVAGPAGSGRSSLVQAGLLPELETLGPVRPAVLRLGGLTGPLLEALAEAMLAALPKLAEGFEDAADLAGLLSAQVEQPGKDLRTLLRQALVLGRGRHARLVVVVDRMERLFDGTFAPLDRQAFVTALEAIAQSGTAMVVGTLRSDFVEDLADIPGLARLGGGEGTYYLAPPDAVEIAHMVRGPAEIAGLRFEAHPETGQPVNEALAAEAVRTRDGLPLLQYTLQQLWLRRQSGVLGWGTYRNLGGLAGAIAVRAGRTLAQLPEEAQDALPGLLRQLFVMGAEPQGKVTSCPALLDLFPEGSAGRLAIDAFAAEGVGLLAIEGDTLRLAHESLLTHWPLMQEQVDRKRAERLNARLPVLVRHEPPALEQPVPVLASVVFARRRSRFAFAAVAAGFLALLGGSLIYARNISGELATSRDATQAEREAHSLERSAAEARYQATLAQREAELRRSEASAHAERADRTRDGEERRERTRLVASTLGQIAQTARAAVIAEDETGAAVNVQAASALAAQQGDQTRIINPMLMEAAERLGIITDPSLRRILSYRLMHQTSTGEVIRGAANSVVQIGPSAWVLPEGGEPARIENAFIRDYVFAPDRSGAILFTDDDRILLTDRRGHLRHTFDTGRLAFSGEVLRAPSGNARSMRPLRDYAVGFVSSPAGSYWVVTGSGETAQPYRALTVIEPVTGANDTRTFTEAWRLTESCGELILDGQRVGLGLARGRLPSRGTSPQDRAPVAGSEVLCPNLRQELRAPISEITLVTQARQGEAGLWTPFRPELVVPLPPDDLPGAPFSPQDAEAQVPGGAAAMEEFTGGTSLAIGDTRFVFHPRRAGASSLGVCAIGTGRPRCLQSFCGENCPTDIDLSGGLFAIIGASLDSNLAVMDLHEMRYLAGPALPRDGVSIAFSPRTGDVLYGTANRQVWRFRPNQPAAPVRRQFYGSNPLGRWEPPAGANSRASAFARVAALEEGGNAASDSRFFLNIAARKALRCARDARAFDGDRAFLRQELACVAADGRLVLLSPERRYIRWISDPMDALAFGTSPDRDRIAQGVQMRFSGEPNETPDAPVAALVVWMPDRLTVLDYASGFVLLSLTPDQLPDAAAREQFQAAWLDGEGRLRLRTDQRELIRREPLSRSEITDRVGALTAALDRRVVRPAVPPRPPAAAAPARR
ncbi:ATP-binding protein [Roseococcus sp.]|uniref:ATP-binding protein n=1 Tax=Roseococcus sp. TaxID=2109646 RepID=UPI003BA907BC